MKVFDDRILDELTNPRLFRLKQRTLPGRFEISHLPGRSNHSTDATSKHSSLLCTDNFFLGSDIAELITAIRNNTQKLGVISWPLLAKETAATPL